MSYISVQVQIIQTREGYASNNGNIGPNTTGTYTLEPIVNLGSRLVPTAVSVPYLTQAPGLALFQNVTCNIKGQTITNFQNAQSVNALYKMLYESQLEQKTVNSTNAINPLDTKDVDTTLGTFYESASALSNKLGTAPYTSTDAEAFVAASPNFFNAAYINNLLTPHMLWALKNQQYNFNRSNTNRINFQIPCP